MGTANIFGHDATGVPIPVLVNGSGQLILGASDAQVNIDEVSATITYVGESGLGVLDSAASWRIKRIEVSGVITKIRWADGVSTFTKIWNDRATYTY